MDIESLDSTMMEFLIYDAFIINPDALPVMVIHRFSNSYPNVPKHVIVGIVNAYLYEMKVREHCDNVGHKYMDDSFGGPEHGYMGVICTRCGFTEGSYLY